jgi:hypothetical protein
MKLVSVNNTTKILHIFVGVLISLICFVLLFFPIDLLVSAIFGMKKHGWDDRPFVFVRDISIVSYLGFSVLMQIAFLWCFALKKSNVFIFFGIISWVSMFVYISGFTVYFFGLQ